MEHIVNNPDESFSRAEETVRQSRKRLLDLTCQIDSPSKYAACLGEMVSRQQHLVAAVDLARKSANTAEATEAYEVPQG